MSPPRVTDAGARLSGLISDASPAPQRSALALFGFVAPCAIALAIAVGDALQRPLVLALAIALAVAQIAYLRYGKPRPARLGAARGRRSAHARRDDARDAQGQRRAAPAALHLGLLERALAGPPARLRQRARDDRGERRVAHRPHARLGRRQRRCRHRPPARVLGRVRARRRRRLPPGRGGARSPTRGPSTRASSRSAPGRFPTRWSGRCRTVS